MPRRAEEFARPFARRPSGLQFSEKENQPMPWTDDSMKKKGAKRMYPKAAEMANAILRDSGDEGMAIATALKHVNKPGAKKARRRYTV
jgi:hypothetical protein